MRKKMHSKTIAVVLATAATLQATGVASNLINGEAFVTANAATGSITTNPSIVDVEVTTPGAVYVTTGAQVSADVPNTVIRGSEPGTVDLNLNFIDNSGATIQVTTSAAATWSVSTNDPNYQEVTVDIAGKVFVSPSGDNYKVSSSAASIKYDVLVDQSANTTTPASVNVTTSPAASATTGAQVIVGELTTPAAVIIKGTERAGGTLLAQFVNANAVEIPSTTGASVRYEWYRLSSKASMPKLVGVDKSYYLSTSDAGKYIKLVVYYDGKVFEDITSVISKRSSHSNGSSSSSSSANQTTDTNADNTQKNDSSKELARWAKNPDGTWKFIENGQPVVGWKQVNGHWYLMDSTGTMQTGWKKTNGKWYLLKTDGAMATGWQSVKGKWYLLKTDGAMSTGWQKVNGRWYFLYNDGSMASNTKIGKYKVDASGAWVK